MLSGPSWFILTSFTGVYILFSVLLVLLLICSAFCSAAEMGISRMNLFRVKQLSQSGSKKQRKKAKRALTINKKYFKYLNTILIMNNIVNLAVSSISTYIMMDSLGLGEKAVLFSTIIVSIVVILICEILPKNLAKLWPEKVAMQFSMPLLIFALIFSPFTFLIEKLSSRMEKNIDKEDKVTATENELVEIVETIEREGVLEHNESELIKSAIKFDEISVKNAMKNKEDVITINYPATFEMVIEKFLTHKITRMPYLKNGKVLGIINQRDVFEAILTMENKSAEEKLQAVIMEPVFISYRRVLSFALEKAQRNAEHMLVVVDNMKNKKYLGIITLEDILEELVGEIYDEHDELPKDILEIGNHIFLVSGSFPLDDLFDDYLEETDPPKIKYPNVGAWIKSLCPNEIDDEIEITYDNLQIKVTSFDKNKNIIKQVEIVELTKQEA